MDNSVKQVASVSTEQIEITQTNHDHVDVIVVGGGLAGLTAARELTRNRKSVRVLEANDRLGGRTKTIQHESGIAIDLGGQWIGATQTEMYTLCQEYSLETYQTYTSGDELLIYQGTTSVEVDESGDIDRSVSTQSSQQSSLLGRVGSWLKILADTAIKQRQPVQVIKILASPITGRLIQYDYDRATARLQALADKIDPAAPWQHPEAVEFDQQTFAQWIDANAQTDRTKAFLRLFALAILATDAEHVSLLHVLFYIQANDGFDTLFEAEDEESPENIVLVQGAQQISECLADDIGREQIHLNAPVTTIKQTNNQVTVSTNTKVFTADHVIVAVPLNVANRIDYDPPMPEDRVQLTSKATMGKVIKISVLYDKPFWREIGLSGQIVNLDGWVQLTIDNSLPAGQVGQILGIIHGDERDRAMAMPFEERKSKVIDYLAAHLGEQAKDILDYVETDWTAEAHIEGGFTCNYPTETWTRYGRALRPPVGRIYWAGTETATAWSGYMEGAVRSGKTAAQQLIKNQMEETG